MAGEQQQDAGADDLVGRQRIAIVARQHELADHVGGGRGRARLDQAAEIVGHRLGAGLGAQVLVAGDLGRADEQGDVVGPDLYAFEVGARHAQKIHDHRGGQGIGEVGDEIDRLAALCLGLHAVDQVSDDVLDVGREVGRPRSA